MADHPILFKGDMILAIMTCAGCGTVTLEIECPKCGSKKRLKTQTRRIVKLRKLHPDYGLPQWDEAYVDGPEDNQYLHVPFGVGGDRTVHRQYCKYQIDSLLWVRETWGLGTGGPGESPNIQYRGAPPWYLPCPKERRSEWGLLWAKHNAKWRPSIFMPKWACRLWLKVKSVRVERLREISEDDAILEGTKGGGSHPDFWAGAFHDLWDSINKERGFGWDENPWIFVISFEKVEKTS